RGARARRRVCGAVLPRPTPLDSGVHGPRAPPPPARLRPRAPARRGARRPSIREGALPAHRGRARLPHAQAGLRGPHLPKPAPDALRRSGPRARLPRRSRRRDHPRRAARSTPEARRHPRPHGRHRSAYAGRRARPARHPNRIGKTMAIHPDTPAPPVDVAGEGELRATIKTSMGDITVRLFEDRAPRTVANFAALATGKVEWNDRGQKTTRPLYSGTIIHRVIPEFMIQMGCPLGTGTGSPGYRFGDEIHPSLKH